MRNRHLSDDRGAVFWYALGDGNVIRREAKHRRDEMMMQCRVLIADDHPRSRHGLRVVLDLRPEIVVVGEAEDGREVVQLVGELDPDLVLMDGRMPVMSGLEATRLIKAQWPEVRIVVLTIDAGSQGEALAAGADAFLVKGCSAEEILELVRNTRRRNANE
jgi:DNA-binding NarL/FixJ family response regulator